MLLIFRNAFTFFFVVGWKILKNILKHFMYHLIHILLIAQLLSKETTRVLSSS